MKFYSVVMASAVVFCACSGSDEDSTPLNEPLGGAPGSGGSGAAGLYQPGSGGLPGSGGDVGTGGAGAMGTGGAATGGTATGGMGIGGVATGGMATGGMGTGGMVTGPFCDVPPTLKEAGDCTGRLVGTALAASELNNSGYASAAREHSLVTAENEMKWDATEPAPNSFNFGGGDAIANFARQNGMAIKGHALVWHSQLPMWVQQLNDANSVRSAMVRHIETVMGHYKGQVAYWDVVNEAIDTDSKTGDGNARMRDSVFYRYLGESYIDEAFQTAHAADPDVKLFYNDYSIEGMNDKSDAVYSLVSGMVARGVPIDGVGLQTHIGSPNDNPPIEEIVENMARLAELGLEVHLSEIDIHLCDGMTTAEQEKKFHDIVAACVAQPACTALTFWGVNDGGSWINSFAEAGCGWGQTAAPLLWNDSFNKKPTYNAVMNALTGN